MADQPMLSLRADRNLAYHQGGSFRYLACSLKAPEVQELEGTAEKKNLNLGLVIDASGSMSGSRLSAAVETAIVLTGLLGPGDRLSLISFADDVQIHLRSRQMDQQGQLEAEMILRGITTRGSTDLAGGWFEGAREVAEGILDGSPDLNHVVLLSDGKANCGILDPEELAEHASNLRARGVSTTAIGIGDDYEMAQLQALAEAGGGRLHDAQHPAEIAGVVLGELTDLRQTLLQDVRVVLSGPDNTHVDLLTPYRLEVQGSNIVAILGSMAEGKDYTLIWRARLPDGPAGMEIPIRARCHWKDPKTGKFEQSAEVEEIFILSDRETNDTQSRNEEVALSVAVHWHGWLMRQAMEINRHGNYEVASELVREQLHHFQRYCDGLEGTEKLITELQQLQHRVGRRMRERSRKEVTLQSFKGARRERDYRGRSESGYGDFLSQ